MGEGGSQQGAGVFTHQRRSTGDVRLSVRMRVLRTEPSIRQTDVVVVVVGVWHCGWAVLAYSREHCDDDTSNYLWPEKKRYTYRSGTASGPDVRSHARSESVSV